MFLVYISLNRKIFRVRRSRKKWSFHSAVYSVAQIVWLHTSLFNIIISPIDWCCFMHTYFAAPDNWFWHGLEKRGNSLSNFWNIYPVKVNPGTSKEQFHHDLAYLFVWVIFYFYSSRLHDWELARLIYNLPCYKYRKLIWARLSSFGCLIHFLPDQQMFFMGSGESLPLLNAPRARSYCLTQGYKGVRISAWNGLFCLPSDWNHVSNEIDPSDCNGRIFLPSFLKIPCK